MPQPKFFRADDDDEEGDRPRPTPGDWFGSDDQKFRAATPTFSEWSQGLDPFPESPYDGWRQFSQGHPRNPLWNPMLSPDTKQEALKFRDAEADQRSLIFVLENIAEILEAAGHDDLAAECEMICEMSCAEN